MGESKHYPDMNKRSGNGLWVQSEIKVKLKGDSAWRSNILREDADTTHEESGRGDNERPGEAGTREGREEGACYRLQGA